MRVPVSMEKIEEWISKDLKIKHKGGRPVNDIMLDKVAMSTLKFLFDREQLPSELSAFLICEL